MKVNELKEGDTVNVRAWWLKGKPCRCSVYTVYPQIMAGREGGFFDPIRIVPASFIVKPLEGNPHVRSVQAEDMIERA